MAEYSTEMENNNVEEISIMELLHIIKTRFWVVCIFVVVAAAAAFAYLYQAIPVYEATSAVLVSPISGSTGGLESLLTSSTSSSKITTEVELITSTNNLMSALNLLDLNSYLDAKGIPYSQREKPFDEETLRKKVSVATVKDTQVVRITVSDSNVEFCRDYANAIVKSYSDKLTTIAKNSKTTQREFLESQIPLNEENLANASRDLAVFKQNSGIIQLTQKNALLSSNASALQLQRQPIVHNHVEQQALYEGYLNELRALGQNPTTLETFKEYESLKDILLKVRGWNEELLLLQSLSVNEEGISLNENRVYVLTSSITSSQKDILNLVLSSLNKDLGQSAIVNAYAQAITQICLLDVQLEALDSIIDGYLKEMEDFPEIERQAEELARSVQVYQALSVSLRQMYEETKLLESAVSGYVTIIDEAQLPIEPVSPKKLMIMAVAVLLGGCFGVLLVFYINYKDVSIKDSTEIKKILGPKAPELGWTPLLSKTYVEKYGSKLITLVHPHCFASERLSVIASNIYYSIDHNEIKVIGVNSATKGEGKTSLIGNLAVSYAQMGMKVIVIDGDLRRPALEQAFGLRKSPVGLCDVVLSDMKLQDVVVLPVQNLPTLHILPGGHVTKNPAMVFNSKKFIQILDVLKRHYDVVLVDSPPASVASEFSSLVMRLDAVVVNIRAGVTDKPNLKALNENLNLIKTPIVGFVYSGVLVNDKKATSYGYGGGKYGYSYQQDKEDTKMLMNARSIRRTYSKLYQLELTRREKNNKKELDSLKAPVYVRNMVNLQETVVQPKAKNMGDDILDELMQDAAASGKKK